MKEYISPRVFALICIIAVLSTVVLLVRWNVLDSQAVAGTIMALAFSLKSLIEKNSERSSDLTPPVGVIAAIVATSLSLSCSPLERSARSASEICQEVIDRDPSDPTIRKIRNVCVATSLIVSDAGSDGAK